MKTRTGFVSNSSSSSFVILGIKLSKEDFEKAGGYDKHDNMFYCSQPEGEDFVLVGKKLGRWDENDSEISSCELQVITTLAFDLSQRLAVAFPDNHKDVSLFYGSVYG